MLSAQDAEIPQGRKIFSVIQDLKRLRYRVSDTDPISTPPRGPRAGESIHNLAEAYRKEMNRPVRTRTPGGVGRASEQSGSLFRLIVRRRSCQNFSLPTIKVQ